MANEDLKKILDDRKVEYPKTANKAKLAKLVKESEPKADDTPAQPPAAAAADDAPPLVGSDDATAKPEVDETPAADTEPETTGNPNPAPTVYDPLPRITDEPTGEVKEIERKTEAGVWCPFCDHAAAPNQDQCVKCGAGFNEDRTEATR